VSVSDRPRLDGAYVSTSSFAPWSDQALAAARAASLNLRTWGDGYGYVLVATGRMEAMVDPVAAYYDLAPMPVILAEAGGRFTDLDGAPGPGNGSGVATNGHVHDELLALLGGASARVDTVLG
jgi:histidinol-phosphatase